MELIWEHTEEGWFVVEHEGQLTTGPFESKETARRFFLEELDITLPEDMMESA